jgi:hypothetical protein
MWKLSGVVGKGILILLRQQKKTQPIIIIHVPEQWYICFYTRDQLYRPLMDDPIETRAKSYMDRFNSEIGNVEKKLFRQ